MWPLAGASASENHWNIPGIDGSPHMHHVHPILVVRSGCLRQVATTDTGLMILMEGIIWERNQLKYVDITMADIWLTFADYDFIRLGSHQFIAVQLV